MIENMVKNFAYLINTYGHIPNGNRSYYISRSQPPFFSLMVEFVASIKEDKNYLAYLPAIEKDYKFWMEGAEGLRAGISHRHVVALPDGSILNRFWDDSDTPRDESYREDTELARTSRRPAAQLFRDIRAAAERGWDFD